mmetsp:Transcript_1512/g.3597  ORF Transcript_1512/g.3597 Transcript_1512/m.3597 type:complete len:236 (+) Transcript_1512:196-903(+)
MTSSASTGSGPRIRPLQHIGRVGRSQAKLIKLGLQFINTISESLVDLSHPVLQLPDHPEMLHAIPSLLVVSGLNRVGHDAGLGDSKLEHHVPSVVLGGCLLLHRLLGGVFQASLNRQLHVCLPQSPLGLGIKIHGGLQVSSPQILYFRVRQSDVNAALTQGLDRQQELVASPHFAAYEDAVRGADQPLDHGVHHPRLRDLLERLVNINSYMCRQLRNKFVALHSQKIHLSYPSDV